jgi:RNA polymerase sigma-70 factor (ECF subfamily)
MGEHAPAGIDEGAAFLAFYDDAFPQVYAYFSRRCHGKALAEDLTAETFLATVDACRRAEPPPMTLPWVIGVARHKLVDHWRRQARDDRRFELLAGTATTQSVEPWDVRLNALSVRRTLDGIAPQHRTALTLRYIDDLPVPEIAVLLGRSLHATEALLVRARAAFRRSYADEETRDA